MKIILFLVIVFTLSGCASNTPFIQSSCAYSNEKVFEMIFENEEDMRTIFLSPSYNSIFFKGTTFSDLKWANDLDKMKFFNVNEKGNVQVTHKTGFVQEFGAVDASCLEELKSVLGDYFVSTN